MSQDEVKERERKGKLRERRDGRRGLEVRKKD